MSLLKAIFRNKENPLSQIECLFQVSSNTSHHRSGWPAASVTVKREKGKQLKGVKTFSTGVTIAISGKDACGGNENPEAHAQRCPV